MKEWEKAQLERIVERQEGPPTIILGIDPGPEHSAAVVQDTVKRTVQAWTLPNEEMLGRLHRVRCGYSPLPLPTHMGIEMMRCYGEVVGASVFDTCVWIGRFIQQWGGPFTLVYRQDQFRHLLGQPTGTARGIRLALIDRFGGEDVAVGGVKCPRCKGKGWFGAGRPVCEECEGSGWLHKPGPLYELSEPKINEHEYDALAVAVTAADKLMLEQKGT